MPTVTPKPSVSPSATTGTGAGAASGGAKLSNARFANAADLKLIASGTGKLQVGSRGEGVKAVQGALVDMGFSMFGGADGAFGQQSARAVRNFQLHARSMFPEVQATGLVDAATLMALDKLAPAPGKKGQTLNIPVPRLDGLAVRSVVVKDEHRTWKIDANGKLEAILGNAVGKPASPTPNGVLKVTGFLDATGTAALAKRMGYPQGTYGHRLIDLSKLDGSRAGQELHGTNAPKDLGLDVSGGCVRHVSADVDTLAQGLRVGDKVAIVKSLKDLQVQR